MAKSLDQMLVRELRAYARDKGVRATGKKSVLLERLKQYEQVAKGGQPVVSRRFSRRRRGAQLYSIIPSDEKRYGRHRRANMGTWGVSNLTSSYERRLRDRHKRMQLSQAVDTPKLSGIEVGGVHTPPTSSPPFLETGIIHPPPPAPRRHPIAGTRGRAASGPISPAAVSAGPALMGPATMAAPWTDDTLRTMLAYGAVYAMYTRMMS